MRPGYPRLVSQALRAVVFDVDFTLAKPGPDLGPEGYRRLGARHGLDLDPARYEDYKVLAATSVEQYGGRYAVRGGTVEVLEGTWPTRRFVVLEFPDGAAARRWYTSPEYSAAIAIRQECADAKLVLVEQ